MSEEDLPMHIKVMMSLGLIKVKKHKDTTDHGTLPKGFGSSTPTRRRRSSGFSLDPIKILPPVVVALIGLLMITSFDSALNSDPQTIRDKMQDVADREPKDAWENDVVAQEIETKLLRIKSEIDSADCKELERMFTENEGWTLRAYVAHTYLGRC